MKEGKQTLWDLYFGIGILSILLAIVGAIILESKIPFVFGVLYGGAVAILLVTHMYQSLEKTLSYDEEGAKKHAQKMTGIRMWIMLAALILAMCLGRYSNMVGVVLGMLTLKVSAYMQPIIHRRITSKIYKKRRVKL